MLFALKPFLSALRMEKVFAKWYPVHNAAFHKLLHADGAFFKPKLVIVNKILVISNMVKLGYNFFGGLKILLSTLAFIMYPIISDRDFSHFL